MPRSISSEYSLFLKFIEIGLLFIPDFRALGAFQATIAIYAVIVVNFPPL